MYDCGFTRENNWFRYRAAAIIIENDCVLFAGNEVEDYYYSIGGGVHHGETAEDAVIREVYEETGLRVRLLGERFPREEDFIRPLGIQKNRKVKQDGEMHMHIDIIYAAVPNDDNEVILNAEESDDIKWFSRNELENIKERIKNIQIETEDIYIKEEL